MHQQINLYQPIFRQERKLFSLQAVAAMLGVIVAALIAIQFFGKHEVDQLAAEVELLRRQQAAQQQLAESAASMLNGQGNAGQVQADVQRLSALLAERTQALELLKSGIAGEPRGFASRLEALARRHTNGVWLDEVLLGSGASSMVLRGRCVQAELLPKYLQLLSQERELSGTRFDQVIIDRRKDHDELPSATDKPAESAFIRFSVASQSALRQRAEPGT